MASAPLQRSIFRWCQATDDTEAGGDQRPVKYHATITSDEIAKRYGVPEDVFLAYMKLELDKEDSCRTLPFSLLMVLSYTAMVIGHDPIVPVAAVEGALVYDIEDNANFAFESPAVALKAIYDVNSLADFWSWMNVGFVPIMFTQNPGISEGSNESAPEIANFLAHETPVSDRQFLLNFNRMIGGIRIRQERGGYKTCMEGQPVSKWWGKQCVDGSGYYEIYPEIELNMDEFDPSSEFWLWAADDTVNSLDVVQTKEKDGWLDDRTMKVEITVPIFNAQYGVYTLIKVMFFFNRGGHIWKRIIPYSTYSQWWYGVWNFLPDALWAAGLLNIAVAELILMEQVVTSKTGGGLKALRTDYLSIWNAVDWANVFFGLLVIIGYTFRFRNSKALNKDLMLIGRIDQAAEHEYFRDLIMKFINALEDEVDNANVFRILLGIYPLLLVTRLFKSFAHQPRLSIVAKTISSSASDMAHFLLVFLSVFLTFAVAGVILFGRTIPDFTRYILALNACFRCMMGDFSWEEYVEIGRAEAVAWFGGFMIGIVLLLLNMLLAIVMDAYSEQKALIGDADTLWDEFKASVIQLRGQYKGDRLKRKEIFRSLRYIKRKDASKKVQIKPNRIQDSLAMNVNSSLGKPTLKHDSSMTDIAHYEEFKLITVDILLKECDRMQQAQAQELIEQAILFYYGLHKETHNDEDMLQIIRKVDFSTKVLKKQYQESFTYEKVVALPDDFKLSLERAKKELFNALHDIGNTTHEEEDDNAVAAFNRVAGKEEMSWSGPTILTTITTWAEVDDARAKCIHDDEQIVLDACRKCGIQEEHDGLRKQCLGKPIRVLELDERDDTVLCRIPTVGDVWFGLRALARREPKPAEHDHYHGHYHHHMTPQECAAVLANPEDSELQILDANQQQHDPVAMAHEEAVKRLHDLETELRIGRQTSSEALQAKAELTQMQKDEKKARSKMAQKLKAIRATVLSLRRENEKLAKEVKAQGERGELVKKSREEYYDRVHSMFNTKQKLAARLENFEAHAVSNSNVGGIDTKIARSSKSHQQSNEKRSSSTPAPHSKDLVQNSFAHDGRGERRHRNSIDVDDDSDRIPHEYISRKSELTRLRNKVPVEDDPAEVLYAAEG